jgi:hypothetical protein
MGQSTSAGSVAGLVSDASGGSVVGAAITLIDRATSTPRTTTSNESGRYNFANVAPGLYQINANKTGFRVARINEIQVTVGTTLTVDFKLEVGSVAETVEVTATGAELQTTNATMGTTLSGETLLLLPNLGRDVTTLLIAQPGVSPDGYSAGANYDQNMYQLDGGNNSNDMDGSMSIYTPSSGSTSPQSTGGAPSGVMPTPVESVEEFKVSTSNQTADFNGAGGAQVQLVTRRGTDSWHGSVYEYYLGSNFGSNTWDNNVNGIKKVSTHQNRFGATGGGKILPKMLGGNTYFFANYEGLRYPLSSTFERAVPSPLFKQGIIQIPDAASSIVCNSKTATPINCDLYNMNTASKTVTVNGTSMTLAPAFCAGAVTPGNPTGFCDPRLIGFNSTIQQLWSKYMPDPTDLTQFGDRLNVQGFKGTIITPVKSDFGVARVDHDFGKNWHFMGSYRMYNFTRTPTVQTDIGGFFPGDKLGQISSTANRPEKPWYLVAGLTTNITSNLTNDFHFSYLRNFWAWQTQLAPPQIPGIPGAIEISPSYGGSRNVAESSNALIPYNVNTQSVRIRFWDGHDWYYRDDLTYIHGNHVWQIGGLFQHNWDFHTRDDNGSGTFNNPVFLVSKNDSGVSIPAAYQPVGLASSAAYNPLYVDLLGISGAQVAYTRAGKDLQLQKLGSDAFDKSVIDTYNLYFTDTWHLKPTFTVNYGLGWLLETPPLEESGKQITLVDSTGNQVGLKDYLSTRKRFALNGQIYSPLLGYELVGNVGTGLKYPYHMFWGGFSPRVSAAWNPRFDSGWMEKLLGHSKTVLRGGYGRVYGRQNGVDLVLVPLLGVGLIQAVKCPGASMAGACLGSGNTDPTNAFRIGVDPNPAGLYQQGISQTLCQPFFPGAVNCNGVKAARASDTLVLDPNYKPAHSDEFNFTIQRDLGHNMMLEVGYLGRIMRDEYMNINLDQVPWMLTLGGQSFANAYATTQKAGAFGTNFPCSVAIQPGKTCHSSGGIWTAPGLAAQPFFETTLASSGYCAGYANCTSAVVDKEGAPGGNLTQQNVYTLWGDFAKVPGTIFNNSMFGATQATSAQMSGAFGRGNYNAAIVSLTARNYKGLTLNTNFTWSRSMGTQFYAQANNGINPSNGYDFKNWGSYGPQPYDIRFVYNLQGLYQLPFFKNQQGLIGRALGGWSIAPFFSVRSGYPVPVYTNGNCSDESWGQGNCTSGNLATNAVLTSAYTAGASRHTGSAGAGNLFADPTKVMGQFRPFILGLDGPNGGDGGPLRGLSAWSLDLTISKQTKLTEKLNVRFIATFSNILNHPLFHDPYLDLQDAGDWGVLTGSPFGVATQINSPRQIEFGLRFGF